MRFPFKKINNYPCSLYILTALILNLMIEIISRRSFVKFFEFLIHSPLVFVYNSLIILFTLSFALFFKKRTFIYTLISIIWLGLGITNGVLLSQRVTPFTAVDITLFKTGLAVAPSYLSIFEIILIGIVALAVISFLVFIWIKSPKIKNKINFKKNIVIVFLLGCLLSLSTRIGIDTNLLSDYFYNIAFAYNDYGFAYCFSNTLINTGIEKPDNYSQETMNTINNSINSSVTLLGSKENTNSDSRHPNIIMIQLESFFDPLLLNDITVSEDPIPNFRNIKNTSSSGFLSVPTIGAGTVNTEFEVLTGMSLDFFGAGEYPYKTILKEVTTESMAYNLKKLNFSTHAIHNNSAGFYDRNIIFSQLGFDTFSSIETMPNVEKTHSGWAMDSILTDQILKALSSTDNEDLVYTITVQSHGKYPTEKVLDNPKITVTGNKTEGELNAWTYYVNELHETDKFIGNLIDHLSKLNENTIVVMYGDHLPTLDITNEELKEKSIYETEYAVWSNFQLDPVKKDLEAYQLSSYILSRLNIDSGLLTKYHEHFKDSTDYLANLKLLQYDMLYGKDYIFDGTNPFIASDLVMGIDKVTISDVESYNDTLIVKGTNFNNYSKVFVNDNAVETTYIDSNTLSCSEVTLSIDDIITVKQLNKDDEVLSTSLHFIKK